MKKLTLTALTLTAAFALTAANYTPSDIPTGLTASDVTPGEINYQGLLRDPKTGNLYVDGIYTLECRLYKQESGGTAIWGASYNAYVKDGYFNLMLGGTGGADLGYTFKSTDLWKALWFKTGSRDLYLGVTPRQNASNAALVSPTEILPRQKLLTAPFAFRAQKAQYADAAPGNFKVDGNLDVAGNVNIASGKSLTLNNITSSSSEVKIGNSKTSPSKATLQGNTVTVEAGNALNVNSHGNATVTMDSGKTLSVNGGSVSVKSTSVSLNGSNSLTLISDTVRGSGRVWWSGPSDPYRPPIVFRYVTVSLPTNAGSVVASLSNLLPDLGENCGKYAWGVAGFEKTSSDKPYISEIKIVDNQVSAPKLVLSRSDSTSGTTTVTVVLLGVIRQWTNY